MIGLDIGPKTVERFKNVLSDSNTILWNGPLGLFENKNFESGTLEIAMYLSKIKINNKIIIIGGGDTAAAISKFNLNKEMTHVSTGGGSSMELMSGINSLQLNQWRFKMSIKPIIIPNWKMNKTPKEGIEFFDEIKRNFSRNDKITIIIGTAFTGLNSFSTAPPIFKAAQNCHWEQSGAYTGEISVDMIKNCGADYVILGHSERRHIFNETDKQINLKVKSVVDKGLNPILCVGETLLQRNKDMTDSTLKIQLHEALNGVK